MENKPDFDKLIVSYLMKELNAEEESFLIQSINTDKELQAKFNEFQKIGNLLNIKQGIDGIHLNDEREKLERLITESKNRQFTIEEAGSYKGKLVRFGSGKKVAAVAAVLIVMLGAGWFFNQIRQQKETVIAKENKLVRVKPNAGFRIEKNNSGKIKQVLLQDGTEILLWDQSEVHYKESFDIDKREIILKGKASFSVSKDKTRPFTVYSGDISTTALGTEFVVTNYESEQIISVRLIEGRVVIKSVEAAKEKLKTDFYLMPGQELVYDKRSVQAQVRKFSDDLSDNDVKHRSKKLSDNPSIPESNDGSWFMFNNQSLPDIFDQLKMMYGIEIVYSRKEVEKLYFIGKFNRTDSIENILKSIAQVNRLSLTKENNRFIIRK